LIILKPFAGILQRAFFMATTDKLKLLEGPRILIFTYQVKFLIKHLFHFQKPDVMKHVLVLLIGLFISTISIAQTYNEEVDMLQALYGSEKRDIIKNFIVLEGEQKTAFWTLYDAYEVERKALGIQRINLIGVYAENYHNLDNDGTDVLVKEMLKLVKSNDKLIEKYYGKLKKKAGVKAAAQFVQIEHYLLSAIRSEVLEEIPFIGQLE